MALGFTAVGVAMLAMPHVAFAQEAGRSRCCGRRKGHFLTTHGAGWLGGAIGAGLAIMGGAAGIGRSAVGGRVAWRGSLPRRSDLDGDDHHGGHDRRRPRCFAVVVGMLAVLKA